jgi:hypothetical protein
VTRSTPLGDLARPRPPEALGCLPRPTAVTQSVREVVTCTSTHIVFATVAHNVSLLLCHDSGNAGELCPQDPCLIPDVKAVQCSRPHRATRLR